MNGREEEVTTTMTDTTMKLGHFSVVVVMVTGVITVVEEKVKSGVDSKVGTSLEPDFINFLFVAFELPSFLYFILPIFLRYYFIVTDCPSAFGGHISFT